MRKFLISIFAALSLVGLMTAPAHATNTTTHYQSVSKQCAGNHTTYSDSWPKAVDPNSPNDPSDDEITYFPDDIRVRAFGYQDLRDVWIDIYKLEAGSNYLYVHHYGDSKHWANGPADGTINFTSGPINDVNRPRHPYLVVEVNYANAAGHCKIYTAYDMDWAPGN